MPQERNKSERVLVTGVFDILHQEHKNFLWKAKALGYLIVGVESDVRVRAIKGEGRPINGQEVRLENLKQLDIADELFILPEQFSSPEDHRALLKKIQPTVLAVSSHTRHLDKKARLMQEIGGRVVIVHEHNPAVSTTLILANKGISANGEN